MPRFVVEWQGVPNAKDPAQIEMRPAGVFLAQGWLANVKSGKTERRWFWVAGNPFDGLDFLNEKMARDAFVASGSGALRYCLVRPLPSRPAREREAW